MAALDKIKRWWKDATPVARALLVTGALAVVGSAALLGSIGPTIDYAPLFSRLTTEDAAAIVQDLRDEKVPYQLADGGTAVLVPKERIYELRLDLAARGLPRGGGVGFEIFDQNALMMTDFTQRVNYTRALQG